MGTTLTAMTSQTGLHIEWVLAIEGYGTLITTGDASSATTAWAATAT